MSPGLTGVIRVIALDAVGTIIQPREPVAETYARIGRQCGLNVAPEQVRQKFPTVFRREEAEDAVRGFRVSEAGELDRWRRIVTTVLAGAGHPDDLGRCFELLWRFYAKPDSWSAIDGAIDTVSELRRREIALAVASNFDSRLHAVLDGIPGLAEIPHRIISSEVGWRKPHGLFFAEVVRRLSTPPSSILFVGDSRENDFDGASAAGMRAVLVRDAPGVPSIRTLSDLIPLVLGR